MSIRRKWAIAPLVLAMAVFAAACSDVSNDDNSGSGGEGSSSAGGVPDNSAITIKLAVNAWVGAEANANVAANLLRDKLGYTVELVKIDEFEQFPALASGDLDATLEVWPSVHPKDYKNYIKADAGVIDAGPLGVVGQIGWFIPTYMVEKDPSLATWEGLKGKEAMFATAETGSSGQLVDADPAFGSLRPSDRGQPGPGLQGDLRRVGGRRAHRARRRVLEAGAVPLLLLDAALGAGQVRPDARRSCPKSRRRARTRPRTT